MTDDVDDVAIDTHTDEQANALAAVLRGLDARQREAVTTDAAPLAIVAAAGSGKTTVLTRRIARRVLDGTADASHVLALTFTREASRELRRRLRRLGVPAGIEAGTFHAVALRLLADRAIAQSRGAPAIAPDRMRLLREVLTEAKVRVDAPALMADIDWARARRLSPGAAVTTARRERRRLAIDAERFIDLWQRYDANKRRRGVVDFDDLLTGVLDAMTEDPTFADVVRWRFRHVFVDEAQDLNPLQFELLQAIVGGRADVCLVGDHRQAIYGWNGADPTTLVDVERRLPGVTIVRLLGNHRCSPAIIRAGSAALGAVGIDDDTEPRRPEGRAVRFLTCADEDDEAATITQTARHLAQQHGHRQVAVLARTNEQLATIDRALRLAGVPSEVVGGGADRSVDGALGRLVAETLRLSNRDALAGWADAVWASETTDPLRRRVAEEIDRYITSGHGATWRSWIETMAPFDQGVPEQDEVHGDDGAIALVTFHAAKGREWRGVIVAGVEAGLVPHAAAVTDAQREEEGRLLHVALTRAADDLVVTTAAARRNATTAESPWLAAVREAAGRVAPVAPPPPAMRAARGRAVDPLDPLRAWRTSTARAAGVPDRAICTDQVLRSLLDDPPHDVAGVATRLGLSPAAAARVAPKLLSLVGRRAPA